MSYQRYLASPEWRAKRNAALERAGHTCQVCSGDRGSLHVHHRTYERVGNELPMDLTVLCEHCHGLFHGKLKNRSDEAFRKWRKALGEMVETPSLARLYAQAEEERFRVVKTRCNPDRVKEAIDARRLATEAYGFEFDYRSSAEVRAEGEDLLQRIRDRDLRLRSSR